MQISCCIVRSSFVGIKCLTRYFNRIGNMFTLKLTRHRNPILSVSFSCLSVCLSRSWGDRVCWQDIKIQYLTSPFSISAFLLALLVSQDEVRQYYWSLIRTVWPNASTSVEDRFWLNALVEEDKSKSTLQRYSWKFRLVFMGQWAQCTVRADALSLMCKWLRLAGRTAPTH